jgi:hypothetical protein
MKRAAIGVRVHSGWGALVAVAGDPPEIEIIDRRRVAVIDPKMPGAKQPYHFVRECDVPQAREHLAQCAKLAVKLACESIRSILGELHGIGYRVEVSAILLASGRALPPLAEILASHPMLHTAEGEFFRQAFRSACEKLDVPVAGIRERELDERASAALGKAAVHQRRRIAEAGKAIGPPWTSDQKLAALAAVVALRERSPNR